jgi:hypothetical protein
MQCQYIDERAVAALTDLEVGTLRNWRVRGEGPPFYKAGRSVKYDLDEVVAWMRARRVQSTSDTPEAARTMP